MYAYHPTATGKGGDDATRNFFSGFYSSISFQRSTGSARAHFRHSFTASDRYSIDVECSALKFEPNIIYRHPNPKELRRYTTKFNTDRSN